MSVSGGPSMPVYLLANAVAHASGSSYVHYGTLAVEGFTSALVEVVCDQATTLRLRGSGAVAAPANMPFLRHVSGGANLDLAALAVLATGSTGSGGQGFQIDLSGLRWLQVWLQQNSGSAATVTVRVTLGR